MKTRYFCLLQDFSVISLGLFEVSSPTLFTDLEIAARSKFTNIKSEIGVFLTEAEVYKFIEEGKNALNTPL